jgi:2-dehydro-3-deoxygluconokinase
MRDGVEVLAVGETMVMVAPEAPGPIRIGSDYRLRPGGAEANVALHLARLGHSAAWSGAVGDDPFGRLILQYLDAAGVNVGKAVVDSNAPTGVYFKETIDEKTKVFYYRANSAASRMAPALVRSLVELSPPPHVLHLTGVTPALSESCRALVRSLVEERPINAKCVSFDVNYRRGLWPVAEAAPELLRLAESSDVVFVGLDEAEELWGVTTPEQVRDLISAPRVLIVKNDSSFAVSFQREITAHAVPETVAVVETVGAGDAFAAGWLGGFLRGYSPRERLELGHKVASHVLRTTYDDVELPEALSVHETGVAELNYH